MKIYFLLLLLLNSNFMFTEPIDKHYFYKFSNFIEYKAFITLQLIEKSTENKETHIFESELLEYGHIGRKLNKEFLDYKIKICQQVSLCVMTLLNEFTKNENYDFKYLVIIDSDKDYEFLFNGLSKYFNNKTIFNRLFGVLCNDKVKIKDFYHSKYITYFSINMYLNKLSIKNNEFSSSNPNIYIYNSYANFDMSYDYFGQVSLLGIGISLVVITFILMLHKIFTLFKERNFSFKIFDDSMILIVLIHILNFTLVSLITQKIYEENYIYPQNKYYKINEILYYYFSRIFEIYMWFSVFNLSFGPDRYRYFPLLFKNLLYIVFVIFLILSNLLFSLFYHRIIVIDDLFRFCDVESLFYFYYNSSCAGLCVLAIFYALRNSGFSFHLSYSLQKISFYAFIICIGVFNSIFFENVFFNYFSYSLKGNLYYYLSKNFTYIIGCGIKMYLVTNYKFNNLFIEAMSLEVNLLNINRSQPESKINNIYMIKIKNQNVKCVLDLFNGENHNNKSNLVISEIELTETNKSNNNQQINEVTQINDSFSLDDQIPIFISCPIKKDFNEQKRFSKISKTSIISNKMDKNYNESCFIGKLLNNC